MIRPCETFSNYLDEPNQNTLQPFDSSDDYVFADIDDDETRVQYSTMEYKSIRNMLKNPTKNPMKNPSKTLIKKSIKNRKVVLWM